MRSTNESQAEALSGSRNALEIAACKGPWLNVVFWLENGELQYHRNTWQFPTEKMAEVVELLSKDLGAEKVVGTMLPDDPLPEAAPQLTKAPVTLPMSLPIDPAEVKTPDDFPAPLEGIVEVVDPEA